MIKKGFMACLIMMLCAAAIYGCAANEAETGTKPTETATPAETAKPAATATPTVVDKPVAINFFTADGQLISKQVTEEYIAEFEAQHPNIKVNLETVPQSQVEEKMRILISTDDVPDVYQLQKAGGVTAQLLENGYVYDLNQLEAAKNLSDKIKAELSVDGKLVDYPLSISVLGFLYNKKMFADIGFAEPPKTWEELMEAGEKLKAQKKALLVYPGKWATGPAVNFHWTFNNYALQNPEFNKAYIAGTIDWTVPEYRALLEEGFAKFNELNEYVLVGSFTNEVEQARQAFVQGQAAMFMGGSWDGGATDALKPDFEWGFMNLPYSPADVNSTAVVPGAGYAINAKSDQLEAAKTFLEYLFSKETYLKINKMKKSLSVMPGVGEIDPRMQDASKRLETNLVMPFANGGQMTNALLAKLGQIAQAVSFGQDIQQAADEFIREYKLEKGN